MSAFSGSIPSPSPPFGPDNEEASATLSLATKKRKIERASRACKLCRERKVKCDEVRPKCYICAIHNSQCLYQPPPKAQLLKEVKARQHFGATLFGYQMNHSSQVPSIFADPQVAKKFTVLEREIAQLNLAICRQSLKGLPQTSMTVKVNFFVAVSRQSTWNCQVTRRLATRLSAQPTGPRRKWNLLLPKRSLMAMMVTG